MPKSRQLCIFLFSISDLKSALAYNQNFVEISGRSYFVVKNTQIWAFGLEIWKLETKENRRFPQFFG